MATGLLRECLSFPALVRGEEEISAGDKVVRQQRRLQSEKLSRTKLVENLKRASQPLPQLEQAVLGSKKQLRSETLDLGLQQRLVASALRETRVRLSPLGQAGLEEREDLVLDILKLQRAIHAQDFQLAQALEREKEMSQNLANKRPRIIQEEEDRMAELKKEQRALRHLFFVLIMESGVKWTEDKVLREIVFSFR